MTTTDALPFKTEVHRETSLTCDTQEVLRSVPRDAGRDLFSEQQIRVFVDLGRRMDGDATPIALYEGGGFVTVCPVDEDGQHQWGLDLCEDDALTLMGALALAVRDLRTAREALS